MDTVERTKLMPLKLKDMLISSDESRMENAPSTDRKKLEPRKIKDLIKSLSARKKPESTKYVYPSKSVDRHINLPRKSAVSSSASDVHARRKLYTTQSTTKDFNPQSKSSCTSKTRTSLIGDINRNKLSRKSSLLPPNSIKEYYIHKKKNKETVIKETHEDVAVQTDTLCSQETQNFPATNALLTNGCQCEAKKKSEICTVPQSLKEAVSNKNIVSERSSCVDTENVLTNSSALISATDGTESRVNNNSANAQLQGQKSSILVDNEYILVHPLPTNQIFLEVPETRENSRAISNVPTMNYISNLNSEHVIMNKTNLLGIEQFLKEGIVNMTQALNLVQATLYSNSLQQQVQSTVCGNKEYTSTFFPPPPIIENVFNPVSELCDIIDVKIEPTYGDTSPPSISFLTPSVSETNSENILSNEKSLHEIDTLRVRLEDCLKFPSTNDVVTKEIQKEQDTIENLNSTVTEQCSRSPTIDVTSVLSTPKRNLKSIENNLLKTPKTIDRNPLIKLMTPSTKTDNKENFQTPMTRRKTFSGMDSQKLRRSVRIARHHLRQSLGEDSFLALERELDIVYPCTKV